MDNDIPSWIFYLSYSVAGLGCVLILAGIATLIYTSPKRYKTE